MIANRTQEADMPWYFLKCNGWRIVGMNHFVIQGKPWLYVAMMRDGKCIVAEGINEVDVFESLQVQAGLHPAS